MEIDEMYKSLVDVGQQTRPQRCQQERRALGLPQDAGRQPGRPGRRPQPDDQQVLRRLGDRVRLRQGLLPDHQEPRHPQQHAAGARQRGRRCQQAVSPSWRATCRRTGRTSPRRSPRLGDALALLEGFIKDNRNALKHSVDGLRGPTQVLVKQRKSLEEAVRTIPLALQNFIKAYDPSSNTISGRGNLNESHHLEQRRQPGPYLARRAAGAAPRSGRRAVMAIRRAVAAGLVAASLGLSGCGILSGGVYDAPLPGGADVGDDPITVTADFTDVLDLVPQSSVKVDNVPVGRVTDITLSKDGRTAEVEMLVRGDLDLPRDTEARLQQTSLLGEKYVALIRPQGSTAPVASGRLADGAEFSTGSTDAAATAEQVLGALSLVLNGGGIAQFQEISREPSRSAAAGPRRSAGSWSRLNRFVSVLDRKRGAITGAIDGLARLGKTLDGDRDQIAKVLDKALTRPQGAGRAASSG
ncbi:MCE family protein [Nocardioides sp. W3-2-3]|uniref:MlaD family protein n=1 Tax=Nocardioides convexus TaxID=2712224 RepID=UPI0024181514|nr:MlaD family protein [Nocardioides convexus]NHA00490.1 MCE family protein [Nocardioides convexus]